MKKSHFKNIFSEIVVTKIPNKDYYKIIRNEILRRKKSFDKEDKEIDPGELSEQLNIPRPKVKIYLDKLMKFGDLQKHYIGPKGSNYTIFYAVRKDNETLKSKIKNVEIF